MRERGWKGGREIVVEGLEDGDYCCDLPRMIGLMEVPGEIAACMG